MIVFKSYVRCHNMHIFHPRGSFRGCVQWKRLVADKLTDREGCTMYCLAILGDNKWDRRMYYFISKEQQQKVDCVRGTKKVTVNCVRWGVRAMSRRVKCSLIAAYSLIVSYCCWLLKRQESYSPRVRLLIHNQPLVCGSEKGNQKVITNFDSNCSCCRTRIHRESGCSSMTAHFLWIWNEQPKSNCRNCICGKSSCSSMNNHCFLQI